MEKTKEKLEKDLRCHLAVSICKVLRTYRAALNPEMVCLTCDYISYLCKLECPDASAYCQEAATKLSEGDEEGYLQSCLSACETCRFEEKLKKRQEEKAKKIEKKRITYIK